MARQMVTQFGMSDVVGPVAVGEREQQIFIGREISHRHEVSEKLAELVDSEIKVLLDNAVEHARRVLTENMDVLHAMANALLERETIDRGEVELLVAGKELPPPPPAPAAAAPQPLPSGELRPSGAGPVLGTPPPKPAGA